MADNVPVWAQDSTGNEPPGWARNEAEQNAAALTHTHGASAGDVLAHDPTEGMSGFDIASAEVGQGMANAGRHIGNVLGLVPDKALEDAKALDAPLLRQPGAPLLTAVGESAPLAATGVGLEGLAAKYAPWLARMPIAMQGLQGATQGYVMGDPGNRLASTLTGAAVGSAFPAAGEVIKLARSGIKPTTTANAFLSRGADLTPGQMNPEGFFNQAEEVAQSLPVIGPMVKNARTRADQQAQKIVMQDAAAQGTTLSSPAGDIHALFDEAYRSYEPLYDQAKGFPVRPAIVQTGQDIALKDALLAATKDRGVQADQNARSQVADWLDNKLTSLKSTDPKKPNLDSGDLIRLRSEIRAQQRKFGNSASLGDQAVGDLYDNAEKAVTQALESQLPTDAMKALQTADAGYGKLKIVQDAVARSKDRADGFTWNQLAASIKAKTPQTNYARGQGSMRDLSTAGNDVFAVRTPKTGFVGPAVGLAGTALYTHPHIAGPALGAIGLGALTPWGRRILSGQTGVQRGIDSALTRAGDLTRLGASALGISPQYQSAGAAALGDLVRAGTNARLQTDSPLAIYGGGQ